MCGSWRDIRVRTGARGHVGSTHAHCGRHIAGRCWPDLPWRTNWATSLMPEHNSQIVLPFYYQPIRARPAGAKSVQCAFLLSLHVLGLYIACEVPRKYELGPARTAPDPGKWIGVSRGCWTRRGEDRWQNQSWPKQPQSGWWTIRC